VIGSYQVNADNRGLLTLTTLNSDGTPNTNRTYAIALAALAGSASTSASASMTEHDDNTLLSGTRGTGTILAQNPIAIASGLTGTYAFGVEGDSPCLPTCTINLTPGPIAQVGIFTAGGGTLSNGLTDANMGATKVSSSLLTGSYGAADANGRVRLTLNTTGITATGYPTDFAAYVVDADHVFLLSTDKHSAFAMLSGTAQLQTQSSFSSSDLNGGFVGYENSIPNPGLFGIGLNNVLNFSTASVFQAAGSSTACNVKHVDTGGVSALVSNLTSILTPTGLANLQGLITAFGTTGSTSSSVASNGRMNLAYPPAPFAIQLILNLLGLNAGVPPRVAYLSSPLQGYMLETGYAALGHIEPQGPAFSASLADLNGTYTYGTTPPASAISTNTSGTFTPNGTGSLTQTVDLSLGIGSINLLQLGITTTGTYTLNSADGRFLINGLNPVIYEISPNRFVLVDTNALTTSPVVNILQK